MRKSLDKQMSFSWQNLNEDKSLFSYLYFVSHMQNTFIILYIKVHMHHACNKNFHRIRALQKTKFMQTLTICKQ